MMLVGVLDPEPLLDAQRPRMVGQQAAVREFGWGERPAPTAKSRGAPATRGVRFKTPLVRWVGILMTGLFLLVLEVGVFTRHLALKLLAPTVLVSLFLVIACASGAPLSQSFAR